MKLDWKALIMVQGGGAICLPVFMVGHTLAKTYGIYSALLAIVLGNLLLLLMGVVSAGASFERRKSTAETAVDVFGIKGKELFALAMVTCMVGWFSIQLNVITTSLLHFFDMDHIIFLNVLLGILMTVVAVLGIKSLTVLSTLSMPVLILTVGAALYMSTGNGLAAGPKNELMLGGISLTLACGIACVIDIPTFFRLAKTKKDGILAVCLLFGFVVPLIEGVGLYLFMQAQGNNIIEVLVQSDSPFLWKIWVMSFLILAGWTTNQVNLYSAAVSLKNLMPKASDASRTLIIGVLGTALSCVNMTDNLTVALRFIGIVLGSMGAVIFVHFLFKSCDYQKENIYVWLIGVAGGILSYGGFTLIKVPVLDAFSTSLIIKLIIKVIKNAKVISVRS